MTAKLKGAYRTHKADAKRRGIGFKFTYEQWLVIWMESGHLHERGTRRGQYCMARFNDKGPYAVGNVKIILHADNVRERVQSKAELLWRSKRMKGNAFSTGRVLTKVHKARIAAAMMGNTNCVGRVLAR